MENMGSTSLPAFAGDVRVWFAQMESYFVANNITTEKRQLHILFSAFPASLMPVIKDVITDPPPGSTYESVKREVLHRTSLSAEKRFQTLVNDEHLGDRTPSQLLRRMRELAEDAPPDSALLKQLFFSRLPPEVKAILAPMMETGTIDQLASSADKIMVFTKKPASFAIPQPHAEVSSFSPASTPDSNQSLTSLAILQAIERLSKEIQKLNVSRSQSPRRRFQSRSPSPRRRHTDKPGLCFYHRRFGMAARSCKPPCSFANQGN